MAIEPATRRFAHIEFAPFLGVKVVEVAHEHAVLHLPFEDENANTGGTLNGGATASLINMAGTLAVWTGIDLDADPFLGTVDLTVQYLGAAIAEDVMAEARVLRRGRDLFFLQVDVRNMEEKPISAGLMIYRAPNYAGQSPRLRAQPELLSRPEHMGPAESPSHLGGFIHKLQIASKYEGLGKVRLTMPCVPSLRDERGQLHEGALAALVDMAGTAAAWTVVQRQGSRGATIGMQLSYLQPTTEAVVADAQLQQRSEELFFSSVHVTSVSTQQLVAMGHVSYRILEPRSISPARSESPISRR